MLKSTKVVFIILSALFFNNYTGLAQASLNQYKYIVIPKKFEAFKKENQYQTNTLVKYLFTKKGFNTVWEDALPDDLKSNQCSALFVSLNENSSLFSTKTTIALQDCNKQEIFATKEGKSKDKDYKASYTEAITESMTSFDTMNYKYEGNMEQKELITVSFKNDVKKLKETTNVSASTKPQNGVLKEEATTTKQTYKSIEPVTSNVKMAQAKVNKTALENRNNTGVLYAQEIANGFQLVDSSPKILMKILKTSSVNYFLAEGELGNGMVYSENGKWYFERYEGENLIREELNIKF